MCQTSLIIKMVNHNVNNKIKELVNSLENKDMA